MLCHAPRRAAGDGNSIVHPAIAVETWRRAGRRLIAGGSPPPAGLRSAGRDTGRSRAGPSGESRPRAHPNAPPGPGDATQDPRQHHWMVLPETYSPSGKLCHRRIRAGKRNVVYNQALMEEAPLTGPFPPQPSVESAEPAAGSAESPEPAVIAEPAQPWLPTEPGERIALIDVLRGLASRRICEVSPAR